MTQSHYPEGASHSKPRVPRLDETPWFCDIACSLPWKGYTIIAPPRVAEEALTDEAHVIEVYANLVVGPPFNIVWIEIDIAAEGS